MTLKAHSFPSPSPIEIFRSMLEVNTYHPPVDLSDQATFRSYNPSSENFSWEQKTRKKVQRLLATPVLQDLFSQPMVYDFKLSDTYCNYLKKHGFIILSVKPSFDPLGNTTSHPYYNVVYHPLEDIILKLGTERAPSDRHIRAIDDEKKLEFAHMQPEDSLLRFKMTEIIRSLKIPGVSCAREVAVSVPNHKDRFVIASERVCILSPYEIKDLIKSSPKNEQIKLADKISMLVLKSGFIDASFSNFSFKHGDNCPLSEREICVFDAESLGGLISTNSLKHFPQSSIEKCGRIGLHRLVEFSKVYMGQSPFLKRLEEIQKKNHPPIDIGKLILLCTVVGFIVFAIISIVRYIIISINYTSLLNCKKRLKSIRADQPIYLKAKTNLYAANRAYFKSIHEVRKF